ncbi:MAG: hypothetical protein AAF590_09650 [Pseudomonadota bacterium]
MARRSRPRPRWLIVLTLAVATACSPAEDQGSADLNNAPSREDLNQGGATPPQPLTDAETVGQAGPAGQDGAVEEVRQAVRQVIPGAAIHAPPPGAVVERLPAPPVPETPPRPVNLGIVVVEAANRLSTRRGMVTLLGTEMPQLDRVCPLADGRTPSCHVLARTAMRRFIGRRTVSCTLGLREDTSEDHVASCQIGDTNLSNWVVGRGWAFADDGASEDVTRLERAARAARRGLWQYTD